MRVGVLALQGDFHKHAEMLHSLGVDVQEVRRVSELLACDGLIIPGGESTTMMRQIESMEMRGPLLDFARYHPVFGTCAGLILMSHEAKPFPFIPLQLLAVEVERNAFGRQIESFQADISLELKPGEAKTFPAFFIRAPRVRGLSPETKILATFEGEPVLVQQGWHVGSSFHPELTGDATIHRYFLEIVNLAKP